MIVVETKEVNGKEFTCTYSNEGYYIRKKGTDEVYSEAYDIIGANYEYEETEDKIDEVIDEEIIDEPNA